MASLPRTIFLSLNLLSLHPHSTSLSPIPRRIPREHLVYRAMKPRFGWIGSKERDHRIRHSLKLGDFLSKFISRNPTTLEKTPSEFSLGSLADHDDAISLVKRERVSPPAHAAAAAHHHALLPPLPPPPPHHVGHHVFAAAQAPSAHLLQALHLSRYGFLTPPPPPPQVDTQSYYFNHN